VSASTSTPLLAIRSRTPRPAAYYRKATNSPTFTDGQRHWALTADGLIAWEGGGPDPPGVSEASPAPSTPVSRAPVVAAAPAVGQALLEDPLTAPGAAVAYRCPTGRNAGEFVGEGLLLKVTGKCRDQDTSAFAPTPLIGITLPDGEIRVEVRAVSGHERATFLIDFRIQSDPVRGYVVYFLPARGVALLRRIEGGQEIPLAARIDLAALLAPDGWNSLAVRAKGPDLSVLVNDRLVLSASDPKYDTGAMGLAVSRLGDVNDDAETAMIVRNLRVSALADGSPARVPPNGPLAIPEIGRAMPQESPQHVREGAPITYASRPPTSGAHYDPPYATYGVFEQQVLPGYWVHNLEHGAVILLYNCAEPCPDLVDQLKDLHASLPPGRNARGAVARMLAIPYPDMDHKIAVVAWGRLLELDDFDAHQIRMFYDAYIDRGPECQNLVCP